MSCSATAATPTRPAELVPALDVPRDGSAQVLASVAFVGHVCGTDRDPQDLRGRPARWPTPACCSRKATRKRCGSRHASSPDMRNRAVNGRFRRACDVEHIHDQPQLEASVSKLFDEGQTIINVGLASFADAIVQPAARRCSSTGRRPPAATAWPAGAWPG